MKRRPPVRNPGPPEARVIARKSSADARIEAVAAGLDAMMAHLGLTYCRIEFDLQDGSLWVIEHRQFAAEPGATGKQGIA